MNFSINFPEVILKNSNGGIPTLMVIGKKRGTPSLVSISAMTWEINPIIIAMTTV